jgi:hypothetical protein
MNIRGCRDGQLLSIGTEGNGTACQIELSDELMR